jgi:hypothetical protein
VKSSGITALLSARRSDWPMQICVAVPAMPTARHHLDQNEGYRPDRGGDDDQHRTRLDGLEAGAQDDEGAAEADEKRAPAPDSHPLAQEDDREDGGEQRHHEAEGRDFGQGRDAEGIEEQGARP